MTTTNDIDAMYKTRYFEIAELLDKTLGTKEEDRSGDGIVQDVHLLAQQRDEARAKVDQLTVELEKVRAQLTDANRALDGYKADERSLTAANTALANERDRLRQQRDEYVAELTNAGNEVDLLTAENARLRTQISCKAEAVAS